MHVINLYILPSSLNLMEKIAQGAEATIYSEGTKIIKDRLPKTYRLPELDKRLRTRRTKQEAKILETLKGLNFPSPALEDLHETKIIMQRLPGHKLRDVLYQDPLGLGRDMGNKIATLHNNNIIHGDLTTSNMLLHKEIHFIDFGLSFFSQKVEDKAVDLHVLQKTLESTHPDLWESCFQSALDTYEENAEHSAEVLKRLKLVELRGKNK